MNPSFYLYYLSKYSLSRPKSLPLNLPLLHLPFYTSMQVTTYLFSDKLFKSDHGQHPQPAFPPRREGAGVAGDVAGVAGEVARVAGDMAGVNRRGAGDGLKEKRTCWRHMPSFTVQVLDPTSRVWPSRLGWTCPIVEMFSTRLFHKLFYF